jgi:C1A family cysteine protease
VRLVGGRGGAAIWLRIGRVSGAVLALVLCAGPARAQLSQKDIEALRERGREEGWTFTVSLNPATQYPLEQLCGAVEPPNWREGAAPMPAVRTRDLPTAFDWRDYGGCTPVRNQGGCGSCWAFSAVGAVESAIKIVDGVGLDLSEQWLVSCTAAGNCGGGWNSTALRHLRCGSGYTDPCGDSGAVLESDFPYIAQNGSCNCPYPHPYCINGWGFVYSGGGVPPTEDIKQAIYNYGPVSACVYANSAFSAYSGGVFNACTNDHDVNHCIVLVGWDDTMGTDGVWILRNSWGSWWGDGGYMYIEYGCSLVGYASCWVYYIDRDCNNNGIQDGEDIAQGTSEECNGNDIPDECDIASGTSSDLNGNQVPDECEDCNGNEVPDDLDISGGTSSDVDANGVPDECEDCNGNEIPDQADSAVLLFQNISPIVGELDTEAPVAQDVHFPGRASLDQLHVHYRSTTASPGVMTVRFFEGGPGGVVVPAYPDGLIGEYVLGPLEYTPLGFESMVLNLEPRLWAPKDLWVEVEIEGDGGVLLRNGPADVGSTQGLVYDRDAGDFLPGPLYLSIRLAGVQCAPENSCTCGDLNGSGGAVNLSDFAVFANCYALTGPTADCGETELLCCDLDGNGTVDLNDFATFASLYGQQLSASPPECMP